MSVDTTAYAEQPLLVRMEQAMFSSCTCASRHDDESSHEPVCRYRVLREAHTELCKHQFGRFC